MRTAMGKPNQLGSAPSRGIGQDQELLEITQAFAQAGEIGAPRGDEAFELFQLRHADRGLHVAELEVVADV